jgi:hypothetical protein
VDYQIIYNNVMERAKNRKKGKYMERHHIIPRCLGGTDENDNLVYLTYREHFIAHKLLVFIHRHNFRNMMKMSCALWMMCNAGKDKYRYTSYTYEKAKQNYIDFNPSRDPELKKRIRSNRENGLYNYGEEHKEKISTALKTFLHSLTPAEKADRMKKSAHTCDQAKRAESIKKSKASKLIMYCLDGNIIEFYSHEDVSSLTGCSYSNVLHRIRHNDGVLTNGNVVKFIKKSIYNNIGKPWTEERKQRKNSK